MHPRSPVVHLFSRQRVYTRRVHMVEHGTVLMHDRVSFYNEAMAAQMYMNAVRRCQQPTPPPASCWPSGAARYTEAERHPATTARLDYVNTESVVSSMSREDGGDPRRRIKGQIVSAKHVREGEVQFSPGKTDKRSAADIRTVLGDDT